ARLQRYLARADRGCISNTPLVDDQFVAYPDAIAVLAGKAEVVLSGFRRDHRTGPARRAEAVLIVPDQPRVGLIARRRNCAVEIDTTEVLSAQSVGGAPRIDAQS